jgi:peroxiredoxin
LSGERSGFVPLVVISGLCAVGIAALVYLRAPAPPAPAIGSPAPEFELASLAGSSVSLSSQRGQVLFVNFWATWCPPCRDEAPSLQRLYSELREEGFQVLAVSIDAPSARGDVEAFRTEFELTFPILLDPSQAVHAAFGVTGVPETYLIDADGRVAERFIGPRNWDDPRYARAVRRLLAARLDQGVEGG